MNQRISVTTWASRLLPVGYRFIGAWVTSLIQHVQASYLAALEADRQQRLIMEILDEANSEKLSHAGEIQSLNAKIQTLENQLDFRDNTISNLESKLDITEGELKVAAKQIEMLLAWQTKWTAKMKAEAAISISQAERAAFEAQRPRESH